MYRGQLSNFTHEFSDHKRNFLLNHAGNNYIRCKICVRVWLSRSAVYIENWKTNVIGCRKVKSRIISQGRGGGCTAKLKIRSRNISPIGSLKYYEAAITSRRTRGVIETIEYLMFACDPVQSYRRKINRNTD